MVIGLLASVVRDDLDHGTMFSVMVIIRVGLVRNVDSNSVSLLESSHDGKLERFVKNSSFHPIQLESLHRIPFHETEP